MYVPIAVRALERLAPVVRPLVDRQRTGDRKRLAAPREVTRIWFCSQFINNTLPRRFNEAQRTFLCVPPHVLGQRRSFGEILAANTTLERPMSGMTLTRSWVPP